jgi:hypothetical protein
VSGEPCAEVRRGGRHTGTGAVVVPSARRPRPNQETDDIWFTVSAIELGGSPEVWREHWCG